MLGVRLAFLFFFSFPFPCNEFCPFVSQRRKEKNKRKVPQGHRAHQGTLHSILKRAGNTLVIYLTKAVIFFSLLHSFIQVQCSSCASLQVETRNCCACASVCPSVSKPQRPSAHVEVYIYAVLLLTSTKTKVECVAVFDTLFMLNMNLKFSPSFVKLARFEKLKGKVCTWYHVSWLYLYELN